MRSLLEVMILAVSAAQFIRVLAKPAIRREAASHPIVAAVFLVGGIIVLGSVVFVSLHSEAVRLGFVSLTGSGATLAWFRARAGYGRSRGLPPGSLGLAESLAALEDPEFYHRSARRYGPVFKMSQVHHRVICITDFHLGYTLLRDYSDALAQSEWAWNRLFHGGYLEFMNGEVHGRYRGILAPVFTPAIATACRGDFAVLVRHELAKMTLEDGGRVVDPERYLSDLALSGLFRAVLGLAIDDPATNRFRELFTQLARPMDLRLPTPQPVLQAYRLLANEVVGLASRAPADSVLGALVATDPAQVTDPTVVGNLILNVHDGRAMTRGLYRWLLKMIAEHPRWTDQIAAHSGQADDALALAFVRETLRRHGSRFLYRRLTRTVEFGGYRLPAGWLVRFCLGEAHEDPDRFPEPTQFDPGRFASGCPRDGYGPFGGGEHACIATDLVTEMAIVFVKEVASGFEVRIVADGPPWRINRHWGFWRPSPRFRVSIAARTRGGVAGSPSIHTPRA